MTSSMGIEFKTTRLEAMRFDFLIKLSKRIESKDLQHFKIHHIDFFSYVDDPLHKDYE